MNQKTTPFLLLFTTIYTVTLFTNISTAHGKRGLDECFEASPSGEIHTIPCQVQSRAMSENEIRDSLKQFRDFEKSNLKEEVFEAAKQREMRLAKTATPESPLMKKIESDDIDKHKTQTSEQFKKDWTVKNDAHQKAVAEKIKAYKQSGLKPELAGKVGNVINGLYRVSITYINDSNFPSKYQNHNVFQENSTASYSNDWKNIIFTHYLGEDYRRYRPELGAVHDLVIVTAFVKGSDELESLVIGKPIKSISHIGNPVGGVEQGEPPLRIKQ